jgi:hypothetical protein
MKTEFLSFVEYALQLSILLNVFMAGLSGFLVYQDRKTVAPVSNRAETRRPTA